MKDAVKRPFGTRSNGMSSPNQSKFSKDDDDLCESCGRHFGSPSPSNNEVDEESSSRSSSPRKNKTTAGNLQSQDASMSSEQPNGYTVLTTDQPKEENYNTEDPNTTQLDVVLRDDSGGEMSFPSMNATDNNPFFNSGNSTQISAHSPPIQNNSLGFNPVTLRTQNTPGFAYDPSLQNPTMPPSPYYQGRNFDEKACNSCCQQQKNNEKQSIKENITGDSSKNTGDESTNVETPKKKSDQSEENAEESTRKESEDADKSAKKGEKIEDSSAANSSKKPNESLTCEEILDRSNFPTVTVDIPRDEDYALLPPEYYDSYRPSTPYPHNMYGKTPFDEECMKCCQENEAKLLTKPDGNTSKNKTVSDQQALIENQGKSVEDGGKNEDNSEENTEKGSKAEEKGEQSTEEGGKNEEKSEESTVEGGKSDENREKAEDSAVEKTDNTTANTRDKTVTSTSSKDRNKIKATNVQFESSIVENERGTSAPYRTASPYTQTYANMSNERFSPSMTSSPRNFGPYGYDSRSQYPSPPRGYGGFQPQYTSSPSSLGYGGFNLQHASLPMSMSSAHPPLYESFSPPRTEFPMHGQFVNMIRSNSGHGLQRGLGPNYSQANRSGYSGYQSNNMSYPSNMGYSSQRMDKYPQPGGYSQPGGYFQPGRYPQSGGYPQNQLGGYPHAGGYSQSAGHPQNQPGGYPQARIYPQNQPGGYPQAGGHPQTTGYSQQGGYPQQGGYRQPGRYPQSIGYPQAVSSPINDSEITGMPNNTMYLPEMTVTPAYDDTLLSQSYNDNPLVLVGADPTAMYGRNSPMQSANPNTGRNDPNSSMYPSSPDAVRFEPNQNSPGSYPNPYGNNSTGNDSMSRPNNIYSPRKFPDGTREGSYGPLTPGTGPDVLNLNDTNKLPQVKPCKCKKKEHKLKEPVGASEEKLIEMKSLDEDTTSKSSQRSKPRSKDSNTPPAETSTANEETGSKPRSKDSNTPPVDASTEETGSKPRSKDSSRKSSDSKKSESGSKKS